MIPSHTILQTFKTYPCYCIDCRWYWFSDIKEGKETCPKCGSENTNKGG